MTDKATKRHWAFENLFQVLVLLIAGIIGFYVSIIDGRFERIEKSLIAITESFKEAVLENQKEIKTVRDFQMNGAIQLGGRLKEIEAEIKQNKYRIKSLEDSK